METPGIVRLLKTALYERILRIAYIEEKHNLHEDFQDIDEDLMISHIKAYIIKAYEDIEEEVERELFLDLIREPGIMENGIIDVTIFHTLIREFIRSLNSLKSNIGDRVNKSVIYNFKELERYKTTSIYKGLRKSNSKIAQIIKDYHGYFTLKELKEKANEEPIGKGIYKEYIISEEELKIIEAVKECPSLNQISHLLYDTRKNCEFHCDHEIRSDSDIFKKLLVYTKKDNPRFNIIFEDGTIVCYNEGDIRIRPYNFKHLLKYTKLYFAKNYDYMLNIYENPLTINFNIDSELFEFGPTIEPTNIEANKEEIARQMIINSSNHVLDMLIDYEDIYTKKIIDDSKKELVKIKEITKKYDF